MTLRAKDNPIWNAVPRRAGHIKAPSPFRSAGAVQNAYGWVTALVFFLMCGQAMPLCAQTNSDGELKLAPPLPELEPTFWEMHHWAVITGAIILLLVLAQIIWLIVRPRPVVIPPPEIEARVALAALAGKPEDGACLSRISQIVRHYFVAAFELPAAEMTTSEMTEVLVTYTSVGTGLGSRVAEFLLECDRRKFSTKDIPAFGVVTRALELVNLGEERRRMIQSESRSR